MDCIFNATFFQPLFFYKIKMLKKEEKKISTRGFVVADPVCEGWRWAQQQFCTAGTSCHLQPFGSPASTL